MKRPAVIDGIIVAVVLSVLAAGLLPAASWMFSGRLAVYIVSAAAALGYAAYLMRFKSSRSGTAVIWLSCGGWVVCGAVLLSLPSYLASLAALVWAVRWLAVGGGVARSFLDAAFTAASFGFAGYALALSGSFAAGLWSFLLLQSLWTLIPGGGAGSCGRSKARRAETDFDRAYASAEDALKELLMRAS